MKRIYLPAVLAAGALTVAAAGCGSSSQTTSSEGMAGMNTSTAPTAHTMSGGTTMSGGAMPGMTPPLAGADGTRAAAGGLW
jgi:hypothetical protein